MSPEVAKYAVEMKRSLWIAAALLSYSFGSTKILVGALSLYGVTNHKALSRSSTCLRESSSHSSTSRTTSSSISPPFEGTVVVCTGPTCTRNGGGQKLVQVMQELLSFEDKAMVDRITIETVNCVSECAECGLGPNCELRAAGDDGPFYPIKNKIKEAEDVRRLLGLPELSN